MKKVKKEKIVAWSHKATSRAALAIRELQKTKARQSILAKKSKMLQDIIFKEGGGAAHGIRAAIRRQEATSKWRMVRTAARDYIVLLDDKAA